MQTPAYSIRLLGAFRVSVARGDGGEPEVLQADDGRLARRATELLELLSLQPRRSLTHDELIETLWPRLEPSAAGANLRKAAHHARQFVGQPDAIVLRGGRVFLLPDREVACDALCFEQAADAALASGDRETCRVAAGLYVGDLLPLARYESWAEAPRERLRAKYLRLLELAGEFERLAEEEPTHEAAHMALMRRELAAGRRTAALQWYVRLRDHLQQVLGASPGADAQALYRDCAEGLHAQPAFVGRALELVRVLGLLSNEAGPSAALLRAPAGMGKTALCRRLAHEARGIGWWVASVQASDWTRPYGLITDLVEPLLAGADERARDALGPHARTVLAAMTPVADEGRPLAMPMARHQVVGAVRRLLLAAGGGKPVLLIVDDAHAADESSAELLAHLAAGGRPLFVLLSCRPQLQAPLAQHVDRMLGAGTLEAIELGPLASREAVLLAERAAGSKLTHECADAIARIADGLPFAVVELAHAAAQASGLDEKLPRNVSAAIALRLCDVDATTREALLRLALAGEEFDVTSALALAGDTPDEAGRRLDAALAADVLQVEAGRYRFRHALLRQALVEAPPHRRVRLHADVAARLERAGVGAGLVAHHWFAAKEPERARPWALAAAREAFRLAAYRDVLRHVEPLLAHDAAHPEALALRAEAMDALGRPGTLAAYDAAAAVAQEPLASELRAKRGLAQVKTSDAPGALEYLRDVHPTTVPGRLAVALAYSGAAALGFGDPAEGTRRTAEVRRIALETGDEGTLLIASWSQAAAAHARGELHASVWADLHETSALPQLAVRVFDGHLCITQRFLFGARPYADVIAFTDALAAEAVRLDAKRGHAFAVTLRGEARLLMGDLEGAEQDLIAGLALHRAIGGATGEAFTLQQQAELAQHCGQPELAHSLLEQSLDVARQSDVGFHLLDRIYGARIAMAPDARKAHALLLEAEAAVEGPLETCPGCRITFAIPATIAAARAGDRERAARHLAASEYLAKVVMRLPAWDAALKEAQAHVLLANGDPVAARHAFAEAADEFGRAGQPLDEARCRASGNFSDTWAQ